MAIVAVIGAGCRDHARFVATGLERVGEGADEVAPGCVGDSGICVAK